MVLLVCQSMLDDVVLIIWLSTIRIEIYEIHQRTDLSVVNLHRHIRLNKKYMQNEF
jgi:hypothetical protein